MFVRSIPAVSCAVMAVVSGCAYDRTVGRPPTADEIEAINRSAARSAAEGATAMTVRYLDPQNPCAGGVCSVEGLRPISDSPPFRIERIVEVDAKQMTVVAETGDVWHLDMSKLAGVTTRGPATLSGSLAGGVVGLAAAGVLLLFIHEFTGADVPVSAGQSPSQLPSTTAQVGLTTVCTSVGAIIGTIVGHQRRTFEDFDFGGGHQLGSSLLSR
jgi:hypothetical protein